MSSLPPGVTDSMCEGGPEQFCANCGHSEQDHDEEKPEACEHRNPKNKWHDNIDCDCTGYIEGEYEPPVIGDDGLD